MNKTLVFVFALVLAACAFAQSTADFVRAEELRQSSLIMVNGKVVSADDQARSGINRMQPRGSGSGTYGGKILVWTDKKFYLPGEEIKVRAMGNAPDAERLLIYVSEVFYDDAGKVISNDWNPCECGDANGGYVPSLAGFTFITLLNKKVPPARVGRYEFNVSISKGDGYGNSTFYQNVTVSAYAVSSSRPESGPITIDQMLQVGGERQSFVLTGRFPVNEPMYYFVGAPAFYGGFSSTPSAISTDGRTLVLPVVVGGARLEGRVLLMTGDGAYSTISPQTFVPVLPALANVAGGPATPVSSSGPR